MVALNSTQHLLPIFEKLLSYSKTLENSFDVGSCIRWLTISVPDRALRAPIVEQLVVKSTLNENGIKAFKQLIKNLENDSNINACEKLATQIHLHNAIRKVSLLFETSANDDFFFHSAGDKATTRKLPKSTM